MMIFLTLLGLSVAVAAVVFLFTVLWYGKFFTNPRLNIKGKKSFNMKRALMVEFLSSFLLSIAVVVVFAPFNLYFGFINGAIIAVAILLPFAISKSAWSDIAFKDVVIQTLHRFFQIIIAFALTEALNSLVFPFLASRLV